MEPGDFMDRALALAEEALQAGEVPVGALLVLPDGRVLNERALSKLRALDSGHAYVEELLRGIGAPARNGANPREWLSRALRTVGVKRLRHPVNHRYLFRLGSRAAKRAVLVGLPSTQYPKQVGRPDSLIAWRE